MATDSKREHSFIEKETRCRLVFDQALRQHGGIWHLCTPGEAQTVIFNCKEDYTYAMNLTAMCAYDCPGVKIVTFEIMSNHIHFILCGTLNETQAFFSLFKRRLLRYFSSTCRPVDLKNFECYDPVRIDNLESMRNQIAYTNRNNYVINQDQTPFSYPYGANSYYFMPVLKGRSQGRFGDLSVRSKRQLTHSKLIYYPDTYVLTDGFISPVSYCDFVIGEGVFRDARHYFHKISREVESYRDIAVLLKDSVFYTDDELGSVIRRICKEKYEGQRTSLLPRDSKIELARILHFDYNADNAKIARMLGIPLNTTDALFPIRKRAAQ